MFESATSSSGTPTVTLLSNGYADATSTSSTPGSPTVRSTTSLSSYPLRRFDPAAPELRAELRSQWVKAKRAATAIAESLERDPSDSFGPVCNLSVALQAMWKLRKHRDDDNWVGILDRLQTTIRELGGDGVALLSPIQGRKLEEFVHDLLSLSEKSHRQLLEAVRLMDEIGVPSFVEFKDFTGASN